MSEFDFSDDVLDRLAEQADDVDPDGPVRRRAVPLGIGDIEKQAREDVQNMGPLTGGARATFAKLSFALAAALDRAYADEAPLEKITAASKMLLVLMQEVAKTANASTKAQELERWLQDVGVRTPPAVGDAEDVGKDDVRGQAGDDQSDAGQAADAAPADDRGYRAGD